MTSLLELYGLPPVIRTKYPTRQDPDRLTPARQVMCPKCKQWQALAHNSFCTGCLIKLSSVEVEQPAPVEVATPEPVASIEASETVTEADEQEALIAELAFEADVEVDRERYFAARSGKYVLLHLRDSGMAVGCSCPSRVKKLRFQGKACKHMTAHNNMLAPAARKQEAA